MSSLRRMNSTRKRSIPRQHRPPADQLAGAHLVAPPPQPDRHRAHHEELVDRRRVHLDRGRHRALRIRHRPRQVRGDPVVAVARELAAEPPDRVADRQRRGAHVEQPVVEEAAMARIHHHRQRTAECAAVEHEPGAGEQRAEVALLDHVPELGPRDPAHAGAEHDLVDPVHRQARAPSGATPTSTPDDTSASASISPKVWRSGRRCGARGAPAPHCTRGALEVAHRVDGRAVDARLEVHVRAEAVAGAARVADDLALRDALADARRRCSSGGRNTSRARRRGRCRCSCRSR